MENREEEKSEFEKSVEENLQDEQTEETVDEVDGVDTSKISEEIEEAREADEMKTASTQAKTATSGGSAGSGALPKLLLLFGVIIAVGAGLVFWKQNVMSHGGTTEITKAEMELLLKDFNPMQLKQLSENPEQKKQLVDNLTELLAIANQARKEGFADKPNLKEELESMEKSLYAINYDRKINADKGPMPPFGYIGEDKVKEFWDQNPGAEAEFKKFIDTKLAIARERGQLAKDQEPSEEELKQAKDAFAKTQIYYKEVKDKLANLGSLPEEEQKDWKEWEEKTKLQIKLQKAQFLTQNYVQEVLTKKFEVTDEEVKKYIEENPELTNNEEKLKKAEEVLQKVKDGGDFAELAKEYSEDPGSKNNGGLYEGVAKGQFAPEFEEAAMALEPGQVADKVVKTNFGYHIIKLEKKGEAKGADGKAQPTFDARHILISTMIKDPDNPMAREMPVEQFVKAKLEKEKQEKILEEIKLNNPIKVAEDFEIPKISDEEIKKMQEERMKQMQQMQQMQQPPPAEDKKDADKDEKKEEPKEDKKEKKDKK